MPVCEKKHEFTAQGWALTLFLSCENKSSRLEDNCKENAQKIEAVADRQAQPIKYGAEAKPLANSELCKVNLNLTVRGLR